MLLLLLACAGGGGAEVDHFLASGEVTVNGGAAGSELVEFDLLGVSAVEGEARSVISLTDELGVYELMFVLDAPLAPGELVPTKVRYRKGLQALLDVDATCALSLTETADVEQPWAGSFSCEGLHTEEGLAAGDEEPWSFTEGSFSGGATTTLGDRSERLAASGYSFHVLLESDPLDGAVIDEQDAARALVIPWRNDETWLVFEDGADESLDDLALKLVPETGRVELRRWARAQTAPDSSLSLRFTATDSPITVALDGGEQETTGEQVEVVVWESVTDGDDEVVLLIY